MRDEHLEDARTVWQRQAAGSFSVTPQQLQEKARRLRTKTRKEMLGNSALALIALGSAVHGMLHTHATGWRIVFAIIIAWAVSGWFLSNRGARPKYTPPPSEPVDGLSFYRQQLKRRNDLFRRFLPSFFGPAVLGMITWILMMSGMARNLHLRVNFVPLCTLLVLWMIGIFILRLRTRKEVKRELAELAALEREKKQND
jgi:hypothetical protein